MDAFLIDRLKAHEGYRRFAYECSEGRLTIGYGTMIENGGHGVPEYIAELLLRDYLQTLETRFAALDWYKSLDDNRRGAILEMGYQMGYEGVLGFRKMIEAVGDHDWDRVLSEALDSRWARQTPARANDVARRLAYGTAA
jgi:lysozyme